MSRRFGSLTAGSSVGATRSTGVLLQTMASRVKMIPDSKSIHRLFFRMYSEVVASKL